MAGGYNPRFSLEERRKLQELARMSPPPSIRAMAEILGRSRYLITKELKTGLDECGYYNADIAEEIRQRNIISQTPKIKPISEETRRKIIDMMESGAPVHAMRKAFGMSYDKLRVMLEKEGYKPSRVENLKARLESLEEGFKMLSELVEELMKRVPK